MATADAVNRLRELNERHRRFRRFGLALLLVVWCGGLARQWMHDPRPFAGWHGPVVVLLVICGAIALWMFARDTCRPLAPLAVFAICGVVVAHLIPGGGLVSVGYGAICLVGASMTTRWLLILFPVLLPVAVATVWKPGQPWSLNTGIETAFTVTALLLLGRALVGLRESRDLQLRLSAELQQANEELRRRAEQAEELAALRERNRLARELHDSLGHALATMTVHLEAVRRVAAHQPEQVDAMLEEAQSLSRQAMNDLRQSLTELRGVDAPPSLDAELRQLARQAGERAGWEMTIEADAVRLPTPTAQALLAIAREALFNAERHAGARHATLRLLASGPALHLHIEDDGSGFDPGVSHPGHFGLAGMHERVHLLGGTLRVSSVPGRGTTIDVEIPLTAAPEAVCQEPTA